MTFSQKCVGNVQNKPTIFLVDEFLEGKGKLTEYPSEAIQSFNTAFKKNMDLLISGPNQSLFKIENKPNLAQVPTFLGSGDVVLGFVHLPPYSIEDDELTVPPVSLINRVMDKVFDRFQKKLVFLPLYTRHKQ